MFDPTPQLVTLTFLIDDEYLGRLYTDRSATLPRRKRNHRFATLEVLVGALALFMGALTFRWIWLGVGFGLVVVGAWTFRAHRQKRSQWLENQKRRPTYQARVSLSLENGLLVQRNDRNDEVVGIPSGEVRESVNGWFLTYDLFHRGNSPANECVRTERASLFLPHQGWSDNPTRDDVAARWPRAFQVYRRA